MRIGRKIQRDTGRTFQKQRGRGQASNTDRQTVNWLKWTRKENCKSDGLQERQENIKNRDSNVEKL